METGDGGDRRDEAPLVLVSVSRKTDCLTYQLTASVYVGGCAQLLEAVKATTHEPYDATFILS